MPQKDSLERKALILKFGQIGDVIMTIPGVYALHRQGFDVHWVCSQTVSSLLACYTWIHVIPVDDKSILFGNSLNRVKHISALWRKLASERYDLCATLYYDRRYRFLTLPIRAKRAIFLSRASRSTALLPGRHHIDEYARVLLSSEDGYRVDSMPPVRPDHLPLSTLPTKTGQRRIALVPGGVNHLIREQASGQMPEQTLRCWPVDSYVRVAKQLDERGWEVVLVGAPEDQWVRSFFEGVATTDCLGTLTLPEVVSVFNTCDAVITHDTGPLHLAGLSTASIVGIFGPTDPATRVPRRSSVVGIWGGQGFACRPCYDGRDFAPCTFNGCMHQVTPELVLRELDRLLQERDEGNPRPWRIVAPEGTSLEGNRALVDLKS
jgi:heptosyltransferase-2